MEAERAGLHAVEDDDPTFPRNAQSQFEQISSLHHKNLHSSTERSRDAIEHIQRELHHLTLQQRDVQNRVRSVRHAMAALISVFGPAVLDGNNQHFRMTRKAPPSPVDVIGLCSNVLQESIQWLTLPQIVMLIQARWPDGVARFQKPSVSISNALRTLCRRNRVERRNSGSSASRWRWRSPPISLNKSEAS